jgi:hypothetical protein
VKQRTAERLVGGHTERLLGRRVPAGHAVAVVHRDEDPRDRAQEVLGLGLGLTELSGQTARIGGGSSWLPDGSSWQPDRRASSG